MSGVLPAWICLWSLHPFYLLVPFTPHHPTLCISIVIQMAIHTKRRGIHGTHLVLLYDSSDFIGEKCKDLIIKLSLKLKGREMLI